MDSWLSVFLLCTAFSTVTAQLYFTLNGQVITDHTLVRMEDIGEGPRGLICTTPLRPCCKTQMRGQWYFPDGSMVGFRGQGGDFYRNRSNDGGVILNRRNGALGPNGKFKCLIPDGNGNIVELTAGIYSDLAFPSVSSHPLSIMNAIPGSRVSFSVSSSNARLYRWVFNGDFYLQEGGRHSGVNSPTLVIENVRELDEGSYHCVLEKELSVASQIATLTVMDVPVITTQPVSLHNQVPGTDITLSITAEGPNIKYHWRMSNGDPLPTNPRYVGGNTAVLAIAGVMVDDAGSYSCVVSNEAGTVVSDPAEISVLNLPIIEMQPENQLELEFGQQAVFSVKASGENLSYQWHFSSSPIDNTDYSGVNTATLTIASVMAHHVGYYHCVISNSAGSVSSIAANLTLTTFPVASLDATHGLTWVNLTWSPTVDDPDVFFNIEYHHIAFPTASVVDIAHESSLLVVGLIPRGGYVFEVQQVTMAGPGAPTRLDVKLTQDIPAVEGLTMELINSTSILVSWNPLPPLLGWNSTYYQVYYTISTNSKEPQRTRVIETSESSVVLLAGVYSGVVFSGSVEVVVEVRGALDVGVEGLGMLSGETASTSETLTVESEVSHFQIVLGPVDYCISWTDEKTSAVRTDIRSSLAGLLSAHCHCNYSLANIADGIFSCRQSSNTVTYRSSISGPHSEEHLAAISQWVQARNATMIIRTFIVDVLNPPHCPVSISSMTEPECANEQGLTPKTLITSDPAVISCVDRCMSEVDSASYCP